MCSKGSQSNTICSFRGKNEIGISNPDSNSINQYFARISAKIDFNGIAQVPIMKLIAAISEKLPMAAKRNNAKLRADAGRCTGKIKATMTAVGSVSSASRNADSPIARQNHIHSTDTGLIKSTAI